MMMKKADEKKKHFFKITIDFLFFLFSLDYYKWFYWWWWKMKLIVPYWCVCVYHRRRHRVWLNNMNDYHYCLVVWFDCIIVMRQESRNESKKNQKQKSNHTYTLQTVIHTHIYWSSGWPKFFYFFHSIHTHTNDGWMILTNLLLNFFSFTFIIHIWPLPIPKRFFVVSMALFVFFFLKL